MLKSPALVPVTVGVFVIVTFDAVPLLSVAVIDGVNPPSAVDGNTTGLGANASVVLPLPVRFTVMGLPVGPVKGRFSCPVRAPAPWGVKVTSNEHCPPSAVNVPQLGGPNEKVKSAALVPVNVMVPGTSGVAVLFVSVNVSKLLAEFTATAPKSKLAGETVTPPATAVPSRLI